MRKPLKIVFLDFDGTINNPGCYRGHSGVYVPADPGCIAALNRITDTTGAAIVVSSTWRMEGTMFCRAKLMEWGVRASVIDSTPRLETKSAGGLYVATTRGMEISAWLKSYERREVESFVILDDDRDMEPHMGRLVQTAGHVGLTMADAEKAIALLSQGVA